MEDKFGLLCISEGKTVCVPLLGVRCDVTVEDFIAQIELTQCFHNAEDKTVEALYRFPVDQASSVCGFSATFDDGSVVTARVKEKEEAKKEYDEATKAGKQAQLLTEERPDVFSITVGNLPPKSSVKITVTLVTTLKAEGVASKLLIPTSIAPRYNPLGSSAVPPVPVSATVFYSLDVTVKYSTRSPIKDISSPTHAATLKESHAGKAGEAAFRGVTMDRDLVVLCEEIDAHAPRACLEVSEDGSIAGLVSLCPQVEFRDLEREFIFIVDRSGSMQESFDGGYGGEGKTQIDYASEALLLFLRALPETCSFNIISFGSHFESLFPTSQPYSDSTLEQATKLAQAMRADFGGTEILQPLQHALAEKSSWFGEGGSAREKQVFILTDGQVSNEAAVFDLVRKRAGTASSKTRVFSVGVGRSVSHHLVEGIARAGKGTACFVTGGADLRTKVLGQLKQALQPGLDAVTVAWNFPSTPKPTTPTPATATAPLPAATSEKPKPTSTIRTLLGYVSPSLNAAASPKEGGGVPPLHGKVRTFPSVAPPVFSGERFLSLALFEASCKEFSESVTITAVSPDGPLVVTLPLTDEEVFKGTIAHRLAAREAIREFEDWNGGTQRGRGRRWSGGAAGASDSSEVISEAEALALALHHSLASARTSFLAVRETPPLREGPASEPAALRVVPQFGAPEPEAHKYMMRGAAPQMMPQMQMAMPCRGAAMGGAASGGGGGFGGMVGAGAPGGGAAFGGGGYGGAMPQPCAAPPPPSQSRSRGAPGVGAVSGLFGAVGAAGSAVRSSLLGKKGAKKMKSKTASAKGFAAEDAFGTGEAAECAALDDAGGMEAWDGASPPRMAHEEEEEGECDEDTAMDDLAPDEEREEAPPAPRPKKPTAPSRRDRKEEAKKEASPAAAPGSEVFALCMLQKADGAFALDARLATCLGAPLADLTALVHVPGAPSDAGLVATLVALAALRTLFASFRQEWELQEDKALRLLAKNGVSAAEANTLIAAFVQQVPALRKASHAA